MKNVSAGVNGGVLTARRKRAHKWPIPHLAMNHKALPRKNYETEINFCKRKNFL